MLLISLTILLIGLICTIAKNIFIKEDSSSMKIIELDFITHICYWIFLTTLLCGIINLIDIFTPVIELKLNLSIIVISIFIYTFSLNKKLSKLNGMDELVYMENNKRMIKSIQYMSALLIIFVITVWF